MTYIRAFGQGKQIDQVKDAYKQAMANDGRVDKNELKAIASELNDVWKLNKIGLMSWLDKQDPQLSNALRWGMAGMDANIADNHYIKP